MKKDKKPLHKGIKLEFKPAGKKTLEEVYAAMESFQRKLSKMKPEDIPPQFLPF